MDSNNINASPNKIYDSIHTKTPVIINHDIIVSEFVRKMNTGFIVDINAEANYIVLAEKLVKKKNNLSFTDTLISEYCWEKYENILLKFYH